MLRSILPRRLKSARIIHHNDTLTTQSVESISKKNIIDQFKKTYPTLKVVKRYDYPRSNLYSIIILQVNNYFIGIIIDKENKKIYSNSNIKIVELLYDIYFLHKKSIWKDIQRKLIYKDTEVINNSSSKLSASHQPRFSIFRKVDKDKSKLISFILKLNYENIFIDTYLINLLYFFEQVEKCNFEKKVIFYNTYCNIKFYLEKKEEIKEEKLIEYFKKIFDIENHVNDYIKNFEPYLKIFIFEYQNIFIGFVSIVNSNNIYMGCNYSKKALENCMLNNWKFDYKKEYIISGLAKNFKKIRLAQLEEAKEQREASTTTR